MLTVDDAAESGGASNPFTETATSQKASEWEVTPTSTNNATEETTTWKPVSKTTETASLKEESSLPKTGDGSTQTAGVGFGAVLLAMMAFMTGKRRRDNF